MWKDGSQPSNFTNPWGQDKEGNPLRTESWDELQPTLPRPVGGQHQDGGDSAQDWGPTWPRPAREGGLVHGWPADGAWPRLRQHKGRHGLGVGPTGTDPSPRGTCTRRAAGAEPQPRTFLSGPRLGSAASRASRSVRRSGTRARRPAVCMLGYGRPRLWSARRPAGRGLGPAQAAYPPPATRCRWQGLHLGQHSSDMHTDMVTGAK